MGLDDSLMHCVKYEYNLHFFPRQKIIEKLADTILYNTLKVYTHNTHYTHYYTHYYKITHGYLTSVILNKKIIKDAKIVF